MASGLSGGVFRSAQRGSDTETDIGPGWEVDWKFVPVIATAVAAARLAIDDVMRDCVDTAKSLVAIDTGQTYESIAVLSKAHSELTVHGSPAVYGEWGIQDRLRDDEDDGGLTTVDVAMFLEFGTKRTSAQPFIYPAWDAHKHSIMPKLKMYYASVTASGTATSIRNPLGEFAPHLGNLF